MFLKLVDDIRARFTLRGFTEVSVDEGSEARTEQGNFGAGSANRVVFNPAPDPLQVLPPRYLGENDDGKRQLWDVVFVYEVSFAGYDADHPNRDLAHRRRCFDLFEVTAQEVMQAYAGQSSWRALRWEDKRKHGRHGAELIGTLELHIPIFDFAWELAAPVPWPAEPKPVPDPEPDPPPDPEDP